MTTTITQEETLAQRVEAYRASLKPVDVDALPLETVHDGWKAESLGEETFDQLNPEPEPPVKPEPVLAGASTVIKHSRGGLWLELLPGTSRSFGDPGEPRTKLTVVVGDKVTEITLDLSALDALREEIVHRLMEHRDQEDRFNRWRSDRAVYEDLRRARYRQRQAAGEEARLRWNALNPDAADGDDADDGF